MPDSLDRFRDAQAGTHAAAADELRRGRKAGHWMWWTFPQLRGLAPSERSWTYGITSLEEARRFVADPVLRARLVELCEALLDHRDEAAASILGETDAKKLRSSMTLFQAADPAEPAFGAVLDAFFDGRPDATTLARLDGDEA